MPLSCIEVSELLALRALLEAIHRLDVVEQERQVEDLQFLGVLLELGQRRRDDLHVAQEQGLHFLAIAEQRRVRVDLHPDLARQAFLHQFLEQQRALALGRVLGDDVGELDDDRVGRLDDSGDGQGKCADERLRGVLEHETSSLFLSVFMERTDALSA